MGEPRSERRTGARVFLALFLLLLLLSVGALGFYLWAAGASGPQRPVRIEVREGATSSDVAALLSENGVIRSSLMFRVMVRLRGLGSSIGVGEYEFRTNLPLGEALDILEAGPLPEETVALTIPEGFRVEQVAERVEEDLGIPSEEFVSQATGGDHALPPFLPRPRPTVEGFLFPSTYEFPADEPPSPEQVIGRLLEQFETEASALPWRRAGELGLTRYEVVIVASLIEREAGVPGDRRKVSAVIHNRLDRGMRLQIDATVQYALPEHKERLTFEDYEYESPYNTYLIDGLPPTPIASPGLASLRAALRPADADYLYYVVVDAETGRHAFTASYEEFLRLKEEAQAG